MADQAQQEQQQQEQSVQQQQPATVVQHDAEMQDAAPDLPRPQKNVTAAQLQALLDGGVAAFEADGPTDFVVDQGHRVTLANAVADLMESTGVIKAQNDKLEAFEQLVKQKDAKASATELELLSAKGAQAARAEKAEAAAAELGRHKVNLNVALGKRPPASVQNPVRYSGEVGDGKITITVWWELLENFLVLALVPVEQWLATTFSLLMPPATNFYLSVRPRVMLAPLYPPVGLEDGLTHEQLLTQSPRWQMLKQGFFQAFGSPGMEQVARAKLDVLTQTGSVETNIRAFCQLDAQIVSQPLSEGDKVYRLLKGLKPTLRAQAHFIPGTTDHIVTMETALRVITAIGALEPEDLSATGKRDLAAAVGGHKGGGNGGGGNKRHRTDPGASGPADAARPAGNAVRTAGNGGGGHKEYPAYCIPKACRLRRKAANQCIKCGVADHFIADCPATEFKDDEGKIYHPKA